MKVLRILDNAQLVLAELEVPLGGRTERGVTLCAQIDGQIIPLNTPDMRPILMKDANALPFDADRQD